MIAALGLSAALAIVAVGLGVLGWGFLASDRYLNGPMRVTCIGLGMILIVAGLYFVSC